MIDTPLLFSDNIVKVNPVPLPPAIDISLKDRHEKGTTIGYGYESRASTNWITITDNNGGVPNLRISILEKIEH
ncbi:hypothetical protein Emtol_1539 [Emticicia oligotrophica DSM 17448]|uniref:BACON domain-containing protein n=1 Tax=Emticicia oligotrophica (strain DSM 17448 / CIP 109782 / MTCC 6937 / GPTSA100-15) TaxID=929562 RepID=A0ABM5MZT3_EMTOG|nr:hypothetical protein [Emticicia oligotrophica]AFK02685.1 hypothetical protein Emtol_1539 [Emticicia oligotrophica DSM 17448]